MFNLAQALLMGTDQDGLFTWQGVTNFNVNASEPQTPQLRIRIFPDGSLMFERRRHTTESWELLVVGRWLNVLRAGFGANVNIRMFNDNSDPSGLFWVGETFGDWISLNVERSIHITNNQQVPNTSTGNLRFEFELTSTPGQIAFEATQSYYNYRAM